VGQRAVALPPRALDFYPPYGRTVAAPGRSARTIAALRPNAWQAFAKVADSSRVIPLGPERPWGQNAPWGQKDESAPWGQKVQIMALHGTIIRMPYGRPAFESKSALYDKLEIVRYVWAIGK
jgi:hypothetical protein